MAMNAAFTPTVTLIGVILLIIAIPMIIAFSKWWIGRFTSGKISKTSSPEKYANLKKYPWVDVLRNTTTTRLLGLLFSLGLIFILMNFTQYEKAVKQEAYQLVVEESIEIEPPRTSEPPPPPPPPPPPVIAEVPNEEIIEEDQPIFEDQTVVEETVFEEVKYTPPPPKEETIAPPPPPPPPPPEESDVEEIFKVVEQMPLFGGCKDKACSDRKLMAYIQKNITYPSMARENGIEGRVFVQFVVEPTGQVSSARILRDIGAGCGNAALEVIRNMNNLPEGWTPGKQRGKAVRVLYTLPATFTLQS